MVSFSDVDVDKPDEKSVMTYVAQFVRHRSDQKQSDSEERHDEEVTRLSDLSIFVIVFSFSETEILSPKWHQMCTQPLIFNKLLFDFLFSPNI